MIKKLIGKASESCATFEVICCVTALYLHRKISNAIYTISGLFRVANIKSKVGIFCPVKERINHSAHGEFNLSLLPLVTIPRKREDATLSKNAEITCGCAMRDASTCEYIALPCFRTNYRGLCDFLAAPLQPILFKISVLN